MDNTVGKSVALGLLTALLIVVGVAGCVELYTSVAPASSLSGYAPLRCSVQPFMVFTLLFAIPAIVMIVRGFAGKRSVRFVTPRHAVAGRIGFFLSGVLLTLLISFLCAQGDLSRGNDPLGKAANYFRFAGEYGDIVRMLPLGLTGCEKELIDVSLTSYRTPEAFASGNVSVRRVQEKEQARATKRGKKGAYASRPAFRSEVAFRTPAVTAFEKAATRTFGMILVVGVTLALFALSYAVRLFTFGHRLWSSFAAGKRGIVHYFGYVPMVIIFGFVKSFRKMPSFHGSPGTFAKTQAMARWSIAAVLFGIAAYISLKAARSAAPTDYMHIAALAAVLSLTFAAVRVLMWAKKAWSGYMAEKRVALDIMDGCVWMKCIPEYFSTGAKMDIYWGTKCPGSPRSRERDIASRAARFLRCAFGRAERDVTDIDLAVRCARSDGTVQWLVCEIMSYDTWGMTWPERQARRNAARVEAQESEGSSGLVVSPVVISPEPGSDDGCSGERMVAWIPVILRPFKLSVWQLLEMRHHEAAGLGADYYWTRH